MRGTTIQAICVAITLATGLLCHPSTSMAKSPKQSTQEAFPKRDFGLGTRFGGSVNLYRSAPDTTQTPFVNLQLPTLELRYFHTTPQETWSRSLDVHISPIDTLLNLFQSNGGPPRISIQAGILYTFQSGSRSHRLLLSSGLGGHFQNLGSRSRGGGSALFRIGYEYLYAKGAFGFSIILIPHMTLDFGNLGRPTRDITMALNAGIGLQIGFFAYSSQTPK